MSSTTTTITTRTPNLFPLGQHLASHILKTLQRAQSLSSKVLTKKALFTSKDEFRAALKDSLHIKRDDLELAIYNYQALYECLGQRLKTPWGFIRNHQSSHFKVISAWVAQPDTSLRNSFERRDIRNLIAHTFNTGNAYRDLEGYLESADEGDNMFTHVFSGTKFWNLLEVELEPLVKELEFAVTVFSEQVSAMPKEVRKVKEIVVEDMSASIPEEWGQGDSIVWGSTESSWVAWVPGVDESWESGIKESWVVRRWRLMASFLRLI